VYGVDLTQSSLRMFNVAVRLFFVSLGCFFVLAILSLVFAFAAFEFGVLVGFGLLLFPFRLFLFRFFFRVFGPLFRFLFRPFFFASSLGVEPKRLGWQRREDWASHTQLTHRLGANQFVCNLIAATLPDPRMGVTAWDSTRRAAARLDSGGPVEVVRPDAGLTLDAPDGAIECFLEWDRATETQQRLEEKIERYQLAEARLHDETQMCNVLFVVPGPGRIATLRRAYEALEPKRERHRQDSCLVNLDGRWPMPATTTTALHDAGPLSRVWESIADPTQPQLALGELPVSHALGSAELARALGRRWRHEQPGFWDRLSPLRRRPQHSCGSTVEDLKPAGGSDLIDQPHSHDDYEREAIP
jgi:hypothetical protein